MTTPCEWIEDYRPGGYLPVHFGDLFKNGSYKVTRKLGVGSFSTVWLARELINGPRGILPCPNHLMNLQMLPLNSESNWQIQEEVSIP
jgi:serine/threonine protein kinase